MLRVLKRHPRGAPVSEPHHPGLAAGEQYRGMNTVTKQHRESLRPALAIKVTINRPHTW